MNIPLDEVIFFDAVTCTPSTGAAVDADSAPTFAVYEESTDTDIGVGGSMTKRTSLTGNYRGSFTLSAANGFEVGKWYSIVASGVVGGVTGKAVLKNFRVVAAEVVAGKPKVDADALAGQTITAAAGVTFPSSVASPTNITAASGITVSAIGSGVITATSIAADAITDAKVASDVTIASVTGAVGSVTGNVGGNVVGSVGSVVGGINTGSGTITTLDALDTAQDAQHGTTQANLATVAGYLDTEIAAILTIANRLDTMLELDGAVYRLTVNALEQAPSGGGGGSTDWTADERTALRTILGIPASGTTPEVPSAGALKVIDDMLDTEVAALTTAVADLPTNAELATALAGSDDATLSAIAAEAVKTAAIKAKTDNLPSDPADQSVVITATDAILTAVGTRATPDQVNAEVLDVLNVDTFAELSAPPAATSSLRAKLTWLFMWARNRSTQTSTERKLYADDATTVVGTEAVSDDGTTYSKGEAS